MFDQIDDMQHIDIFYLNVIDVSSKIILYLNVFHPKITDTSFLIAIMVKIISVFLITLFTKK